ncbi:MAG TPA: carboxymuconolactone decarboxylase family protein [Micromonosporaceae bacterium]
MFRRVLTILGLTQIRHTSPVWFDTGDSTVIRVYHDAEREFGVLAPPLALHASAPEVLAAVWLMLRETLIVDGVVSRAVKEAVATAVSVGNSCPYCVSVHSGALDLLLPGRSGSAIAGGDIARLGEADLRPVAEWARASGDRQVTARPIPVAPAQAPEVIGVAVLLHYLNRMVNVFLRDVPMPPGAPRFVLGTVTRVLATVMRRAARADRTPGASLDLLPPAPLPPEFAWAAGNPAVAEAFARACAAIDSAAVRSVPASVRELLSAELAGWDGRPRGISRSWVDQAVAVLPEADRPAGRLALLTAFASYQVDRRLINDFRTKRRGDRRVVELAAWASLAAARTIAGWARIDAEQVEAGGLEGPPLR